MTLGTDTIFALASGVGRAGIAVLRVSGDKASEALITLGGNLPPARRASVRRLCNKSGETLDEALVLWFPPPGSYTGEACAEFHIHGGPAVLNGVADALVEAGLRPAEPGEFTHRAFLNGRMDLTAAEAVADLIDAETTSQRLQALRQLGGGLSEVLAGWSHQLLQLLAQQEALVDFPDEDLPPGVEAKILAQLDALREAIRCHLADERRGERLRTGVTMVVAGPPNAGKSSLVNYLCGRDVAIVSPAPGTTRDVLEARLVLSGVPVTVVDTAGLRDTPDPIEHEGVRRAITRISDADIIVRFCEEGEHEEDPRQHFPSVQAGYGRLLGQDQLAGAQVIVDVRSKCDLRPADLGGGHSIDISVVTGEGLEALKAALCREIVRLTQSAGQAPLTRARHRAALNEALARLDTARETSAELRAEDIRLALRSLGRITGQVGVEEILGQIFSQFCIGK